MSTVDSKDASYASAGKENLFSERAGQEGIST